MIDDSLSYMGKYYHKNKEKFNNPKEKEKRRRRNANRRKMTAMLGASALKGKEVDHIKPMSKGGSDKSSNLRVVSKTFNRTRKRS